MDCIPETDWQKDERQIHNTSRFSNESNQRYIEMILYFFYVFGDDITKTRLIKYIKNLTTKKGKFSNKKSDIFIFLLWVFVRAVSNHSLWFFFFFFFCFFLFFLFCKIRKIMYMYTHVNPSLTIKKWGLRGSKWYIRVFAMEVFYRQISSLMWYCFWQDERSGSRDGVFVSLRKEKGATEIVVKKMLERSDEPIAYKVTDIIIYKHEGPKRPLGWWSVFRSCCCKPGQGRIQDCLIGGSNF